MGRSRFKDKEEEKRERREKRNRRRHEAGGSDDDQDGGQVVMAPVVQVPKPKRKGKPRTADKGDADTQARREAKKKAAELVRDEIKKIHKFSDIPKFTLGIVEDSKMMQLAIQRWVYEICGRSRLVQSTDCRSIPVTPPQHSETDDESDDTNMLRDEISYHILEYLGIDGIGNLQALVRETDGYVIAIRPEPTDPEKRDGWGSFIDVDLPSHLFGTRNWKMVYESAYNDQKNVTMGNGLLNKMVAVLLEINEANCKERSPDRERMLDTIKVLGGEVPRLSAIFRFFLVNINSKPCVALEDLSFWTNHWRKLGDAILHLLLGLLAERINVSRSKSDALVAEGCLRKAAAIQCLQGFEAKNIAVSSKSFLNRVPHGLVKNLIDEDVIANASNEAISLDLICTYIMLIKYHNTLVPELIMRKGGNTTPFKVKVSVKVPTKDKEKKEKEVGE